MTVVRVVMTVVVVVMTVVRVVMTVVRVVMTVVRVVMTVVRVVMTRPGLYVVYLQHPLCGRMPSHPPVTIATSLEQLELLTQQCQVSLQLYSSVSEMRECVLCRTTWIMCLRWWRKRRSIACCR